MLKFPPPCEVAFTNFKTGYFVGLNRLCFTHFSPGIPNIMAILIWVKICL